MKKITKILGITCAVLVALGVVFIIIGIANGGKHIVESDLKKGKLSVFFSMDDWFDDDDNENKNMSNINKDSIMKLEKTQYQIQSLKVQAKYGEIKINQWNEECFGIENKAKSLDVKYEVIDGVLNVSVSGKIGIFKNNVGDINVYIPKDKLSSADLSIGAGELECNGLFADSIKIEVGAGEGKVKNSEFGQCDINVGMGELELEGTTVNSMNIDCGMGEVKAELNNSYNDFDYKLKVGAGEIELGTQKYEGISKTVDISNNTGRTMDIDCGMGEVTIEFNK